MGAPIIVNPRQNPWTNLLPQLFMMKIQHKMSMDAQEARREDIKAERDIERKYQSGEKEKQNIYTAEQKQADRDYVSGFKPIPVTGDDGTVMGWVDSRGRFTQKSKPTAQKPQQVWSKQAQSYVYRTPEQIAQTPDAYGMKKQTLREGQRASAPQISIGEKQKQKDEAYYQSPKFIEDVQKDVKSLSGRKYRWMTPVEKEEQEKTLADKRVRIRYPEAQYGEQDGKVGWYVKDEDGNYKLKVNWSK